MKKTSAIGGFFFLLLGVVLLYVLTYSAFSSGIYRKTTDIDVNSGVLRYRTCVFIFCLQESKEETVVSRYALKVAAQPDWRRVAFVPLWPAWLPHSRAFIDPSYYGVPGTIQDLGAIWDMRGFSDIQKRETADTLLRKWREDKSSRSGGRYVYDLGETPAAKQ